MNTKTLICQRCGKKYEILPNKDGSFSTKRKYCDDCQRPKTKELICKKCGKVFSVGRGKDGNFLYRQYCDDCLAPVKTKEAVCKSCGKTFALKLRKDNKGFLERSYCDDCLTKPKTETHICKYCGKEFEVEKYPNSHKYVQQYYCSDFCRKMGFIKNRSKTCLDKYGKTHYAQTEEFLEKYKKTCQEKYGVDYPCLLPQCKNANPVINSKINQKFASILDKHDILYDTDYKIDSYFYDFYLIKHNTLIEINPTFTHTCVDTGVFPPLDKNYHKDKIQTAQENNYKCINVWDWDNWDKIINQILPKEKLYARKLQLREIDKQTANSFLDMYHLQNSCYNNVINLGLCQDDKLVQIMTFGKPRYNKNYQWELLRLCSHSDYKIVGGTSKLFKYFVNNYNPESIISYCDLSKFTGNVYNKLGFKLLRINPPVKYWSKNSEHITSALLLQKGFDKIFKTDYGKGTNNEELMIKHGWLPIYDCGQAVYVWQKEV